MTNTNMDVPGMKKTKRSALVRETNGVAHGNHSGTDQCWAIHGVERKRHSECPNCSHPKNLCGGACGQRST